jgi:glucosamine-6-phosphate deaminase
VKVLILPDAAAATNRAAGIIAEFVQCEVNPVLGLATGETMRPVYARLVALNDAGQLDFAPVTTFNLDEYVGVPADHPASFSAFMHANLFDHVNINPSHINLMVGDAPDPDAEAMRYEAAITAAGGVGLQVLGIGRNGHVAFNEPTSSLASRTRVKTLTEATRRANAAAFAPDPVPRYAITLGIGTILSARRCLLIATGPSKAAAVARMIEGALGADCPATALQMHQQTTVVLDEEAASHLQLRDYYETVHPAGAEPRLS